jgi:hypothetical protein
VAAVVVGSKPGEVNLTGKRGDRWGPFQFTAADASDLSGRTWLAQVRTTQDRPAEVLAAMVVDSSDAATGVLRVSILPAESSNLATGTAAAPPGVSSGFGPGKATYYWDLQATLDGDATDVKTWFGGKVIVEGDVAGDF